MNSIKIIIVIALSVVFVLSYKIFTTPQGVTGYYIYNIVPTNCDQQVSYEVQEPYTETEPYTYYENIPLKYSINENAANCNKETGSMAACIDINIENLDDVDGIFSVTLHLDRYNVLEELVKSIEEIQSENIKAGSSHKFSFKIDINAKENWVYNYDVKIPDKQVQKMDYRNIEKTRSVTKYRTEKVC